MYVYKTQIISDKQADIVIDTDTSTEICYWHNHPNLHAWFHALYIQKGGKNWMRNNTVHISSEDIAQLERDIVLDTLPCGVTGFFMGTSARKEDEGFTEQMEYDLSCIEIMKKANQSNHSLWYDASW